MKKTQQFNFTELISIKKSSENETRFILNEINEITEKDINQVIEPTYDSIFKSIFTEESNVNGKNGRNRLLNMLNSILFPENEESKITEILLLPNEYHKISDEIVNCIKFDIACKAKIQNKQETHTIDIEMQLGKDFQIKKRLFNYSSRLFQQTECPTIVLSILNSKDKINVSSSTIHLEEKGPKGNKIQYLNFIEIIIINLKEEIDKLKENKPIFVNNKKLKENGINWLKFLGLRQWGYQERKFFILPKNIKFNVPEIESAYTMILKDNVQNIESLFENEELKNSQFNMYFSEGKVEGIKEGIKKGKLEGIKEGIKKGIKEGIEKGKLEGIKEGIEKGKNETKLKMLVKLFNERKNDLNDIFQILIGKEEQFPSKEIRKQFSDDEKYNSFITLIGKKRILEEK